METRSADSANIPLGARSATAKDIAESNALPNKPVVSEFIVTPRASWTYLSGYFVYNQTTSYNCGPAAVQAALRYLNALPLLKILLLWDVRQLLQQAHIFLIW